MTNKIINFFSEDLCAGTYTQTSMEKEKKNPVICYDFTYFAGENEEENIKVLLRKHCKKWAFQLEKTPTTDRLHFQGRLWLKTKQRLCATLYGKFPGWHLSITTNEGSRNAHYVMKEETRVKGPWTSEDDIEEVPSDITFLSDKEKMFAWQRTIIENSKIRDDRSINVIVDCKGGIGKSTWCNWMAATKQACLIPFCRDHKDMLQAVCCLVDTIKKSGLLFIDLPRALDKSRLKEMYTGIEVIKSGQAYDHRHKFRQVFFVKPHVWVFTNGVPNLSYLSTDRWKLWQIVDDKLVPYNVPQPAEVSPVLDVELPPPPPSKCTPDIALDDLWDDLDEGSYLSSISSEDDLDNINCG